MKNGFGFITLIFPILFCLFSCADDNGITLVNNNDFSAEADFAYEQEIGELTELDLNGINGEVEITGISDLETITVSGIRKVESDSQSDADDHLEDIQVIMEV